MRLSDQKEVFFFVRIARSDRGRREKSFGTIHRAKSFRDGYHQTFFRLEVFYTFYPLYFASMEVGGNHSLKHFPRKVGKGLKS